mmetsp:Transcript_14277/g.28799  ORF Transcript_14277/g.28799 Transcript_14277/m.28799 type:complete len:279 (-) Transcript_14277:254-1090(-)
MQRNNKNINSYLALVSIPVDFGIRTVIASLKFRKASLQERNPKMSRRFAALRSFQTDLKNILPNPLLELQRASQSRGICDKDGYRLTGAPWGFQLAEVTSQNRPKVRTIGFQRVSEHGIDYLLLKKKRVAKDDWIALSYTEGIYPPPPGQTCEQWRAEGVVAEIDVENVLDTAPMGSFAQILAVARRERSVKGQPNDERNSLCEGQDKDSFIDEVAVLKAELENGNVDIGEIQEAVQVCRLMPSRMELMVSGGIWERFEYVRLDEEGNEWDLRRIMPY